MAISGGVSAQFREAWGPLPHGWKWARFGDILEVIRRPVRLLDNVMYTQPVIRRNHGGIEIRSQQPGNSIKTKAQFEIRQGDWLMSKVQIMHRAYGIVPRELDGAVVSGSYFTFRTRRGLDPKYLWHLSQSRQFHRSVDISSVGVVIEKMVFRVEDWLELEFPLPPLAEQRKIAATLGAVDNATARIQAIAEQLQVVKKALMQELFAKGLPGRHQRFKQTEIGRIPSDWDVAPLGTLAYVQTGLSINKGRSAGAMLAPYLRVANVQDGWLDLEDVKRICITPELRARYSLREGDVLFTEGGDADKLGRGTVWRSEVEGCVHQNHVFAVRCGDKMAPDFLSLYRESPRGKSFFAGCSKQTTNLASINCAQLRSMPIPIPPLDEQWEIAHRIDSVRRYERLARDKVSLLRQMSESLTSRLLTGALRVTPSPAPEYTP